MNAYNLTLVLLFIALVCQAIASGQALEIWLRRDQGKERRRMALAFSATALIFALEHGFSLELAARTGMYDFRQAMLALPAGLLMAYAMRRFNRQSA